MKPQATDLALDAAPESFPLMPCTRLLAQEILEDFSFLLDERDLALNLLFLAVDEVGLVLDQDAHPLSSTQEDGMCIVINMGLKVKDLSGLKQLARPGSQLLSVCLSDAPHIILFQFLLGEQEGPNMIKVFKLQACKKVREGLKGHVRFPILPSSTIIQGNRGFLNDMKSQLFHGKESGTLPCGWPGADAGDGGNLLLAGGQMNTDCKGKTFAPLISTGLSRGNGADVAFVETKLTKLTPKSSAFNGSNTFLRFIEDLLN